MEAGHSRLREWMAFCSVLVPDQLRCVDRGKYVGSGSGVIGSRSRTVCCHHRLTASGEVPAGLRAFDTQPIHLEIPSCPCPCPVGARSAAPAASRRLGTGEAAVVIASIAAVTLLAVLQRPIPSVLTALVAAVCLLLLPGRWR